MANFPTPKLLRLAAQRAVRLEYVQEAQRAAADNIYTIDRIIRQALPLVQDEEQAFRDAFGEPMPPHVRTALNAEISMWEHLQQQLATFAARTVSEEELAQYTAKVRDYLAIHADVLRMQEELVTSCLVEHYTDLTDKLLSAASWVAL